METNKKNALEMLLKSKRLHEDDKVFIDYEIAINAVLLASTWDWIPAIEMPFNILLPIKTDKCIIIGIRHKHGFFDTKGNGVNVVSFCFLP